MVDTAPQYRPGGASQVRRAEEPLAGPAADLDDGADDPDSRNPRLVFFRNVTA
jgi:hypothetical protein